MYLARLPQGQAHDLPSLDPLVFVSVARKHHWGASSLARGYGPDCISVSTTWPKEELGESLRVGGRALCEAHEGQEEEEE